MSRRSVVLLLAVLMVAAGCGTESASPEEPPDPFEEVERALPDPDAPRRAAPRWEEVMTISGDAPTSEEFPIAEDALQWRARFTCESGELQAGIDAQDEPLVDAACPEEGEVFAIETGWVDLDVDASGPFAITIEQQVDTVHEEPPLDGMDDAEVVATGEFAGVERTGEGTATLYRMPDGTLALRFTEFQTVASPDLFVWVSGTDEPTTSEAVFTAPYTSLGPITSTLGDQNYVLPEGVEADDVRSVVIWCAPLQIAYAAAPMDH